MNAKALMIGKIGALAALPLLLIAVAIAWATDNRPAGAGDCPNDPPVAQVAAEPIYSDIKGSVVDADNLHRHEQQILPLRNFVTDASERADSADRNDRDCALRMMLDWAKNKAMQEPPADFGGLRELARFTISLNIIALKLRAGGMNVDPLLGWLGDLNQAVIDGFGRRNRVDNLYVWSGVAAASYAILSRDDAARRYQDTVWIRAIGAIRPDGYVDSELRRGGRALLYHVHDLSAVLTLQAFRNAQGESITAHEHAALTRLVGRVGGSLCNSSEIGAASGGAAQETPPTIEFAPIVAFGTGFANLRRCGPPDIPTTDPIMGGNLDKIAAILANRPATTP